MNFWPFPVLRNYEKSPALSSLFLAFAADESFAVVQSGYYDITVKSSFGTLNFWNANRYYAWASSGCYTRPNGSTAKWKGKMPSRYAVRAMRKAIDNTQFETENNDAALEPVKV